jgi:hypothetical protein
MARNKQTPLPEANRLPPDEDHPPLVSNRLEYDYPSTDIKPREGRVGEEVNSDSPTPSRKPWEGLTVKTH